MARKKRIFSGFFCFFILVGFFWIDGTSVRAVTHSQVLLTPVQKEVEAGDYALYAMQIVFNDSSETLHQAKVRLTLPSGYSLANKSADLTIAGVAPSHLPTGLLYDFGTIEAGTSAKVILKIKTENGQTPSGTQLTLISEFSAEEFTQPQVSRATVTVVSSLNVAMTTLLKEIVQPAPKQTVPWPGDEAILEAQINIPTKKRGMHFLKPGSKLRYVFSLPEGVSFVETVNQTRQPISVTDNKIIWEVTAPSLTEQQAADSSLVFETLRFKIKFSLGTPPFIYLPHSLQVIGEMYDGSLLQTKPQELNIMLSTDGSVPPNHVNGAFLCVVHRGPIDGKWGISERSDNVDPTVYSNGKLAFGVTPAVGHSNGILPKENLEKYEIYFYLDSHLQLNYFQTGKNYYRYNSAMPQLEAFRQPVYDAYVKYADDPKWYLVVKEVQPYHKYQATAIGIDSNKVVEQLRFSFREAPTGLFIPEGIYYYTTIKDADYAGKIENRLEVQIRGIKNLGNTIGDYTYNEFGAFDNQTGKYVPENEKFIKYTNQRTANVVKQTQSRRKIVRTQVILANHPTNVLSEGDKQVQVNLFNDESSVEPLKGPFESYLLLPRGMHYSGQSIKGVRKITDNYQQKKQELLQIKWSATKLAVGERLSQNVPVTLDEAEASSSLKLQNFVFLGEADADFTVPEASQPTEQDTMKMRDEDDINNNNDTTEAMVASANRYNLIKNQQLQIRTKLKTVTGDKTSQLHLDVNELNQSVDAYLELGEASERYLDELVLMAVLPSSVGYGLTSGEYKRSSYPLTLSGPIELPKNWQGKVSVLYSTNQFPAVSGILDQSTEYPSGLEKLQNHPQTTTSNWLSADEVTDFKKIRSFKIQKKATAAVLNGRGEQVICPLQIPKYFPEKDVLTSSAWFNYSLAGNQLPATESAYVPITISRQKPMPPLHPLEPDPTKPVDPINPIGPDEPTTGGPLSIDFASSIDFGTHEALNQDVTYFASGQKLVGEKGDYPNYIQVTDARSIDEHAGSGWKLMVTQVKPFATQLANKVHYLKDASLFFTRGNIIPAKGNSSLAPEQCETTFSLTPKAEQKAVTKTVITAANQQGYGTWLYRFGRNSQEANESIMLVLPGKSEKIPQENYQTDLIWTLVDAF